MVIRYQHQCLHFLLQSANLRSSACVYRPVDCGKTFANQRIGISEFVGRVRHADGLRGEMNSLNKENTRLGFIGIGNMGSRIARRLLDDGYRLMAYNRSREAAEGLIKYGATVADSISTLASEVDVILSSLTNDEAVKSVYTDPQGVFAYVRRGSAIIDMSTVLPATSRELYDLSREAGVKCLDSPISGSTPLAEKGTLTLFCGGDEELFQAAQPIFSVGSPRPEGRSQSPSAA
jgi:6-phosphogluconate dehydrogenase (decarboxylating)